MEGLSLSDLGLDGLTDDTEVTPGGRTTITLEIDTDDATKFTAVGDGSGNFTYNGLTVSGNPSTITIFDDEPRLHPQQGGEQPLRLPASRACTRSPTRAT